MDSFATVEDYVKRYGPVSDEGVLQECLNDCTRELNSYISRFGVDLALADDVMLENLMQACRQMAYRAMPSEASTSVPFGAKQYTQSADGFSESFTLANPYGDVYISRSEEKLLGLAGGRSHSVRVAFHDYDCDMIDDW